MKILLFFPFIAGRTGIAPFPELDPEQYLVILLDPDPTSKTNSNQNISVVDAHPVGPEIFSRIRIREKSFRIRAAPDPK
jgi:hypothetical protein